MGSFTYHRTPKICYHLTSLKDLSNYKVEIGLVNHTSFPEVKLVAKA